MNKRLFDLFFVIPGLLLLTPLFILIGICIKLDSSGPILFRQKRVGRNEKLFIIYKFRTMKHSPENQSGQKITVEGDSRITCLGKWLRKFKIDEFPQLLNILKGEMSLVGPRPEVPEYVEFYPKELKAKIFAVQPGLTDLASIEFRNENMILANESNPLETYREIILPKKLEYYVQYAENHNLFLDFKIIIRTLISIIK